MTLLQTKSIDDAVFHNGAAKRVRVDLVLKPVTVGTDTRLISRLLALREPDALVLEVPTTGMQTKVFLPAGWQLGMAFELDELWIQARTIVLDHCVYSLFPGRQTDGVVVQRPESIDIRKRRSGSRHKVCPSRCELATIWTCDHSPGTGQGKTGMVEDYSQDGLGVRMFAPLELDLGTKMLIRIQAIGRNECITFRAEFTHCTLSEDGSFRAGFANVVEANADKPRGPADFLSNSSTPE